MHFRNGQWVKFPAPPESFPGAHRNPDGWVVGIYVAEGYSQGVYVPEHIAVAEPVEGKTIATPHPSICGIIVAAEWNGLDIPACRFFPKPKPKLELEVALPA